MDPIAKIQFDNNRETRERWKAFAEHRRRVSDLVMGAAQGDRSRLCVLGAGNCNDLDLNVLLAKHQEIHLIDLDEEALIQGVLRQGLQDYPRVTTHGGVDLTGLANGMADWTPNTTIDKGDLTLCVEAPCQRASSVIPGPFDAVVSTCLLSQLISALVKTIGERHPQFVALLQAVRMGHLRLLTELLAPGGSGILITDVVSSDTYPTLATVAKTALPTVLAQLVKSGNFFHGVKPSVLLSLFRSEPILSTRVTNVEPIGPWLWDMGKRTYAVIAIRFQKV